MHALGFVRHAPHDLLRRHLPLEPSSLASAPQSAHPQPLFEFSPSIPFPRPPQISVVFNARAVAASLVVSNMEGTSAEILAFAHDVTNIRLLVSSVK